MFGGGLMVWVVNVFFMLLVMIFCVNVLRLLCGMKWLVNFSVMVLVLENGVLVRVVCRFSVLGVCDSKYILLMLGMNLMFILGIVILEVLVIIWVFVCVLMLMLLFIMMLFINVM